MTTHQYTIIQRFADFHHRHHVRPVAVVLHPADWDALAAECESAHALIESGKHIPYGEFHLCGVKVQRDPMAELGRIVMEGPREKVMVVGL